MRADERDRRDHVVEPTRKEAQHPPRVLDVERLPQQMAIHDDRRVRGQDQRAGEPLVHDLRLGRGNPPHVRVRRLVADHALVDVRRVNVELNSRGAKQFGPPRRCRRKDEAHRSTQIEN
jgi:hypothetical protein